MTVKLRRRGAGRRRVNAVAGGGSFIGLPALMPVLAPVAATAPQPRVWPGSLPSVRPSPKLSRAGDGSCRLFASLSEASWADGRWCGHPTCDFNQLPWLMAAAALTFTIGERLADGLRRRTSHFGPRTSHRARTPHLANSWWILSSSLAMAIYGGYFGGGMGHDAGGVLSRRHDRHPE